MESRNPVFGRSEQFSRGGYATFDARTPSADDLQGMYDKPAASWRNTDRMTLDDVIMRTASLFGVLLVTAVAVFALVEPSDPILAPLVFGGAIVGLVMSLIISFSKKIRPALMFVYAAAEGLFVGGISLLFNTLYDGIVAQAVLGTLGAFVAMLALYKFGVVKATPKFTKILMIAGFGYLAFGLINMLVSWISGNNAYNSPLGWLIAAFGVGLAAFFLVLDFDFVEQGIRNGLPQEYAWTAAFGLVVTLVWLYIEILRLLAILRGDD
ncbi:Bax inhibitor-1/YccA family protein [Kineosporia sp. J2-2]|uniref:Bax inhibitor-1/YccA family protein n=1 Tax=Kineosporia corallincola TaxID=2835133 RepID=A0ABS5THF3_9ACTN|nr:Bax inhibitor-1/YccA family protein [Kineosporia corallincola]MBT0770523.1 Bax inhibitor-1/YccA family protein [Kineosporia corallincola]